MAGWPPEKNATFSWFFYIRDADGDLVAGATALDVEFSIDGGVFADVAGTEVDEGEGLYSCPITAAEMNGDVINLICKTSTSGAKTAAQTIYTSTRQIDDLAFPSVSGRNFIVETDGMIHADLKEWLGSAPNALVGGRIDASVGAMAANVITAAAINAAALTAAKFAAGALDANALAADAVAEIADGVWDEPLTGHTTLASVGQVLNALGARTGAVADAGALAADFDVDGFTEATNAHFDGSRMVFTTGVLIGQSRIISTYTGAGQNCAFDRPWTEAPANNDEFVILPSVGALSRAIVVESDGQAHADLKEWLGIAPLALVSQRVDASVGAMAAAVLTAAAIATDAITSAKIAAGAIGASEAPNLDAAVSSRLAPTVAARTLDVAVGGEAGLDFGNTVGTHPSVDLNAAAINLIWDELTSEGRVGGSFGQLFKDNIDATISSRAIAGDAMALTAAAVDLIWDEDVVAAHGGASSAGLLLRALGALISTRTNNATLNALLGVADVASRDVPEQVWAETIRDLTQLGFVLDATDLAADTIGASEFSQAAADKVWDTAARTLTALGFNLANTDFAAGAIDAAALATDAVNEIRDAILNQLSARRNTAVAGAAGSITLDAGAPITVDLFKGQLIFLDSGTGVGQVRLITAYSVGRVATVTPDWVTNPVSGTTFVILSAGESVGITGTINDLDGLNNLSAAQVNAEMVDVVNVDAISELSQAAPTATPTINTALMLMYMALRNKLDVDANFKEVHNNAGAVITKKALTDAASVYSEAEMETGP